MAKLEGGPLSRATGKMGGVVFCYGPGGNGKDQIMKQLVRPSNPKTKKQTDHRSRFRSNQQIAQTIDTQFTHPILHRSHKNQNGYQSTLHAINSINPTGGTDKAFHLQGIGTRYMPNTIHAFQDDNDHHILQWSQEAGGDSELDDFVTAFLFGRVKDDTDVGEDYIYQFSDGKYFVRSYWQERDPDGIDEEHTIEREEDDDDRFWGFACSVQSAWNHSSPANLKDPNYIFSPHEMTKLLIIKEGTKLVKNDKGTAYVPT